MTVLSRCRACRWLRTLIARRDLLPRVPGQVSVTAHHRHDSASLSHRQGCLFLRRLFTRVFTHKPVFCSAILLVPPSLIGPRSSLAMLMLAGVARFGPYRA